MTIFATPNNTNNVADAISRIKNANTTLYKNIITQHSIIFNLIWNNARFTPKEILDGFGNDAIALFMLSEQLQQMAKSADPNYTVLLPPSKYIIQPNEDGTVTITDKNDLPSGVTE